MKTLRFSKISLSSLSKNGLFGNFFPLVIAVICCVSFAVGQADEKQMKRARKPLAEGEKCLTKKDYPCALKNFDEAVRVAPDYAAGYEARGRALEGSGKTDEAIAAYGEALRRNYNKPAKLYASNCSYYSKKNQSREIADNCLKAAGYPENAATAYFFYYFAATAHAQLGEFDKALEPINQAVRLKPDEPLYQNSKAFILQVLKRPQEALEAADQAIKLKPGDAFLLYTKAGIQSDLGKDQAALETINQAIKSLPSQSVFYSVKASILNKMKRYEEAAAAFLEQAKLEPQNDKPVFYAGQAFANAKNKQKARESFVRASQINPKNHFAWLYLSFIYQAAEDWQNLLDTGQRLIILQPDWDAGHYFAGTAHFALKQPREAIIELQKTIEIQLQNPSSSAYAAQLKEAINSVPTAGKPAATVSDLPPMGNLILSHILLGWSYRDMGQPAESNRAFERALLIKPQDEKDNLFIGIIHRYYGRWDEAIKSTRRAIIYKDDDDDSVAYGNLAWFYALKGEHEAAVAAATEVIERDPKNADAYATRCRAQNDLKLYDAALADCQKALELDPSESEALYYIGRNYRLQKNYRKADEINRQAIVKLRAAAGKDIYGGQFAYYTLGNALVDDNQFLEAIKAYLEALRRTPKHNTARLNLGFAYVKSNNKQGALDQYKELTKFDQPKAEQLMGYIKSCRTCR